MNIPIAFLVPSSSGHAALVMPILAPLADFAGVSRSVAVTGYQSASGFVNYLTPTAAVVMGGLTLAKVRYDRYLRFLAAVPGRHVRPDRAIVRRCIGERLRARTMRVVVALGGNALLRRGEPMTIENQRDERGASRVTTSRRSRLRARAGRSRTATVRRSGCSRSRAPRTSRSPVYPLDVLGAETQGMIGYLVEQELGNRLPVRQARSRRCSR